MNNLTRRELLGRHKSSGFPGSIIDVFRAYDKGVDLIGQYEQQQMQVAQTQQQQQEGLRPAHQAGNTNASMAFPNQPPNAKFNTRGMRAPIDIKQVDDFGNLVASYNKVPPGISNLKMSSQGGTVIETPSQMKSGGIRKFQSGEFLQSDNTKVSTPTPQTNLTLNPPRFEPESQGTITQAPYDSSDFWRDVKAHNLQDDSTFENAVEAFDPTGVSSWDDAYRAYNSMQNRGAMLPNADESLDMFGAIPVLGKAKFAFNLAKKAQKPLAYYGTQFYNNFGRHVINNVNRADALEDETGFLNEMQGGGFTPAPRMGVMQNPNGSVSTHKYATETLDGENWFSFPTLFQNPDSSWIDMEPKEGDDWYPAYEEALRRGEVLDFGKDMKGALKWGEGSWKDPMKSGGVKKYFKGNKIKIRRK